MSETRRLSGGTEHQIEEATQWAHENGHDDSAIRAAISKYSLPNTEDIRNEIRERLRRLFGR